MKNLVKKECFILDPKRKFGMLKESLAWKDNPKTGYLPKK